MNEPSVDSDTPETGHLDGQARAKKALHPALIVLLAAEVVLLTPQAQALLLLGLRSLTAQKIGFFATVFLGIFIEALPFLLLGTLASGIVEVLVGADALRRIVPGGALGGALIGGLMGLVFPVCECGVVPLVRRMFRKGLPIPAGVAFLLAGPVLNPVVLLSTAAAFGVGEVLFLRMGMAYVIAVTAGLVFSAADTPWEILRATPWLSLDHDHEAGEEHDCTCGHAHCAGEHIERTPAGILKALRRVLAVAQDELFEMGRYLVIGALLAAGLQTFIPQGEITALGKGPFLSVAVMMLLALLLSICSTVDAFIALGFAGAFSTGSILGFLVFGPMVDIKSILMYWRVFRSRPAAYLVLIPLALSLLGGVIINFLVL